MAKVSTIRTVLLLLPVAVAVISLARATHAAAGKWTEERVLKAYGQADGTYVSAGPGSATNNLSQVSFGSVLTFDVPMTALPSATSKYLGQVRGLFVLDSQPGNNILDLFTIDFTSDEYNGAISISGSENLLKTNRTVSITGGSGDFLLIKGYAKVSPIIPEGGLTNGGTLYAIYFIELHYALPRSLSDFFSI